MGLPYDLNPQRGSRRQTLLRTIFFLIILGTLPFYLLGFILWGTAPDRSAQTVLRTPTPTHTPIGGEAITATDPPATWTPRPTFTPGGLGPTPGQFIPPPVVPTRFLSPTPMFIPTSTDAPTLTPFPTNTPVPLPTSTPLPPPTNTPLPPPTNTPAPLPTNTPVPLPTNTPVPLPTNTPASPEQPTPLLPPTDTPAPGD